MADILAEAQVMVGANLSNFDQAMDLLPSKAKRQIEKTVEIIETKIKAVKAEIPLHVGNPAEIQQLNDYLAQLKANLDSVKTSAIGQAQAIGQVSAAMGKAAQATQRGRAGFQNLGYGLLMVSQAVEDLQYGFNAIVNNIPGIAMAFGASAGVAGGLSLASVAINVLINNWEKLGNALGMGKVKTAAEEMEELRKKTSLTADEAARLARFQNLENKVKELRGGETKKQQAEEQAATEAIKEAGFGNVVRGIRGSAPEMVNTMGEAAVVNAKLAKLRKELEVAESIANNPGARGATADSARNHAADLRRELDNMTKGKDSELEKARDKSAEDIVASGALPANWSGQREKILAIIQQNPGRFGALEDVAKLTKRLREASPEFQQREASRQQRIKGRQDQLATADKQGLIDSGGENFAASQASDRLDQARKALAKAIEDDPYSTGAIAKAEEAYQKSIEDQEKLLEQNYKKRKQRIDEMADRGLIDPNEEKERRNSLEAERTRDRSGSAASKKSLDDIRKQQAIRLGGGFESRYRMQALRDIGLGREVDQGSLRTKVAGDLERSGSTKEDAAKMAEYIVKDMVDKVQGQVNQEAQERGIGKAEAGKNLAGKEYDEKASKAYHEGGFSDLSGFYAKLQSAASNSDQYAQMTAENTREAAEAGWQIVQQLQGKAAAPPQKAPPAVAQGPV